MYDNHNDTTGMGGTPVNHESNESNEIEGRMGSALEQGQTSQANSYEQPRSTLGQTAFYQEGMHRSDSSRDGAQNAYQGNTNYGSSYTNGTYDSVYGAGQTGATQTESVKSKKRKMKKEHPFLMKIGICAALAVVFGGVSGTAFLAVKTVGENVFGSDIQIETTSGSTQTVMGDDGVIQPTQTVTSVVTDVTDVVEQAMPSIVSIVNRYVATGYFGQSQEAEGTGSGIIVGENDQELLIATNYHVVEGNDSLEVVFADDTTVNAQVKGTDSSVDLAVIAVAVDDLSQETRNAIAIAKLGDSDNLKVGEPVVAIGNSLGYGQSVTTGVVSAVDRELTVNNVTNQLIQTDAAINPGNSGGALLNINGEVIGINSNKIGGSVVEGMGYAIPISSAEPILEKLMTKNVTEKVSEDNKGYIGIAGVDVTSEMAQQYGKPQGIFVAQVYEGSAAEEAGIVRGDIIVGFDGREVSTMAELQEILSYYSIGTIVEIDVLQDSAVGYQQARVTLTLGPKMTE